MMRSAPTQPGLPRCWHRGRQTRTTPCRVLASGRCQMPCFTLRRRGTAERSERPGIGSSLPRSGSTAPSSWRPPRTIKPSLNIIAKAAQGGPNAPTPTAADWGVFFLLVPVVSTTFASIGRMFPGLAAGEIGWVLIDEAGQASPQSAIGALWRARRAVVIGDPLQIRPVVTTPPRTTRLIFASNGADPADWAAPAQSAQTLADRVSPIQGRFRVADGGIGQPERVTGHSIARASALRAADVRPCQPHRL